MRAETVSKIKGWAVIVLVLFNAEAMRELNAHEIAPKDALGIPVIMFITFCVWVSWMFGRRRIRNNEHQARLLRKG